MSSGGDGGGGGEGGGDGGDGGGGGGEGGSANPHIAPKNPQSLSHVALRVTTNPSSHVGWQVSPDRNWLGQSPRAPFSGALGVHGTNSHVVAVRTPNRHVLTHVSAKIALTTFPYDSL
jgi:hypothetical protein